MSDFAAWTGEAPGEDPPPQLAVITPAPPTFAEREAQRAAEAASKSQEDRAKDAASDTEVRAWQMRARGEEFPDVPEFLARQSELAPGGSERTRHRQAREILRRYGLEDVLGGTSGTVIDANVGVLEREPDVAHRSQLDYDYETRRSLERAEEGRRFIEGIKARRRAAGLDRVSYRSAAPAGCSRAKFDKEGYCGCYACAEFVDADMRAQRAETDRLVSLGFSRETAEYAATPVHREIVR